MSILIAVLLLSCACQLALTAGSTVILHDASRHILRPSVTHDYSYAAATAAVCAATGLVPPYQVDQDVDKQVAQIVQPNIFNRPKALLVLQLTGVPPDPDHLAQLLKSLEDGHTAQLHINSSSKAALLSSQLVQAVDDIVAANFDVDVKLLDHSGLQGCDPSTCLSGHLSAAVQRCGGKVLHLNAAANSESQQQQQHPHGSLSSLSLQLPGLEQPLQLSHAAARLFALELAGLQGSTQHVMQELKQQTGQQYGQQQDEEFIVYESTIVSLQGLRALHPEGSAELAAAESALVTAMNHVVSQLKDKYGEDILIQVSLLGDVPVSSGQASHLLSWKEQSRRALLERAGGSLLGVSAGDEVAATKNFAGKAAGYSIMLILIWFTLAGIYCMVSMKFKQDTLLYGRTKTD